MLEVTHTSSVTEDQIDHLGHMNVVFYGVNAHAATRNVLAGLDGWPDGPYLVHDTYTRHHREQLLGTPLIVRSAFLDGSADGLRIHHELAPANAESLAAVFLHRVSPIDADGKRTAVPGAAVSAAHAVTVPPRPYASARTIDLTLDPLSTAPTLDVVQERKLEVRKPRLITAEECDENGNFRPDKAMLLLWAGEPPDHAENWGPGLYEGPDGELMGWAVMETRVQLDRIPRVGTRIQSFAATIALHDRATHRLHWCYDLDTGRILCSFEGVDVAFDTRARRTMVIPDRVRQRLEASLHTDLAP